MPSHHAVVNGRYDFPASKAYVYRWYCKCCHKARTEGTYGNCTHCHFCEYDTRDPKTKQEQSEACDRRHRDNMRSSNSRQYNRDPDSNRSTRSRNRTRQHHERQHRDTTPRRPRHQDQPGSTAQDQSTDQNTIRDLQRQLNELQKQVNTKNNRAAPATDHHRTSVPTYVIHDNDDNDDASPEDAPQPTEAELQQRVDEIDDELKSVNARLEKWPNSQRSQTQKADIQERLEKAKSDQREAKCPTDRLRGKTNKITRVAKLQADAKESIMVITEQVELAEEVKAQLDEKLVEAKILYFERTDELAKLNLELGVIQKELALPQAKQPRGEAPPAGPAHGGRGDH